MKPLRLLQRRIIATNLFFVLILLLGILTALFLNARARSMKEAGRYLAAELRFASFFSEYESEASSSSDEIGPPPDGAQAGHTTPMLFFRETVAATLIPSPEATI